MSTSDRRAPVRTIAALAVLAVTFTGGCSVNTEQDAAGTRQESLLADGIEIDLATPPTREELAMPEDRGMVVLEREDRSRFPVTVRFRDGHTLTVEADQLGVDSPGPGQAPEQLVIVRDDLDMEALRADLDAAAGDVGADRAGITAYLDQMEAVLATGKDHRRTLTTAVAPPDRLTIQPITTALERDAFINYTIRWDVD